MQKPRKSARPLAALFAISSLAGCATLPDKASVCTPEEWEGVYSFDCTPVTGPDYAISFERARRDLVCRPLDEDLALRRRIKKDSEASK